MSCDVLQPVKPFKLTVRYMASKRKGSAAACSFCEMSRRSLRSDLERGFADVGEEFGWEDL
jgi:hypothetical protein